ncbi:MAG: hypothetical protein U9N73_10145 [Candidatus Auribacterota bacterium]|nr:hypothetical protein [Candidatus Auribacterota bacterium]
MRIPYKILLSMILITAGCSPIEMGRRIAGTSIQALEEEEKGRFSGIALAEVAESYEAVYTVLQDQGLYIYLESPGDGYLIAMWFDLIFPRCLDTTEVGFFLKEESPGRTKIDVVSLNSELARSAAELVFEELNNLEWIGMLAQDDNSSSSD